MLYFLALCITLRESSMNKEIKKLPTTEAGNGAKNDFRYI